MILSYLWIEDVVRLRFSPPRLLDPFFFCLLLLSIILFVVLTARLHYRSIYVGSVCFNLVRSNAPVYTADRSTRDWFVSIWFAATYPFTLCLHRVMKLYCDYWLRVQTRTGLLVFWNVNKFCKCVIRQRSVTMHTNTYVFPVMPTDLIPNIRYCLH